MCFFKGKINSGTWLLNLVFLLERLKNLPPELYLFSEGRFSGVSNHLYILAITVLASW